MRRIMILFTLSLLPGCSTAPSEQAAPARTSPGLSSAQAVVRTSLEQINAGEGRYFSHVWNILHTDGGVEALIAEAQSPDASISHRATELLHMISRPPSEKRIENPNWADWWQSTGSKMTVEQLWHNFDSYHK